MKFHTIFIHFCKGYWTT